MKKPKHMEKMLRKHGAVQLAQEGRTALELAELMGFDADALKALRERLEKRGLADVRLDVEVFAIGIKPN